MFARTARLLLRPGWPEDALALTRAIGDQTILTNLASAPSPYRLEDALRFLAAPHASSPPPLLVFERGSAAPRLVGGCALVASSGAVELGYWTARADWGRGFATEAATALIGIARTLGIARLEAFHFLDNPASARVLAKLGFESGGIIAPRHSQARGGEAPARRWRLALAARPQRQENREPLAA